MSFNITHWKTKELVDLRIPIDVITSFVKEAWGYEVEDTTATIMLSESGEMRGTIKGNVLSIEEIKWFSGEGSGNVYPHFKKMLKHSTGGLIAAAVWEGGEHISILSVLDGEVAEATIEL